MKELTVDDIIKEIKDRREQLQMYIQADLKKSPYTDRSNMQFYRVAYWELNRLLETIESGVRPNGTIIR